MKTKRFAKIALLALTAVLLVGVILGVTVSAADEAPAVRIAGKNLCYDGAVQILYYVETKNFDENDQQLKVEFYYSDAADAKLEYTKVFTSPENKITLNGKEYYGVYSNGFAPIDMTKKVYAKPVITDNSGNTLAEGKLVEYSIYNYAINRFSQSPTEDQVILYKSLLDYGASVQEIFLGNSTTPANGLWADTYYQISENVYVDGVYNAEKSVKATELKRPSDFDAVGKNDDGNYVLAYANSEVNGAYFKGITTDEHKGHYSTYAIPGKQTYNIYYTTEGTLKDFENNATVGELFEGGSYTMWNEGTVPAGNVDIADKTTAQGGYLLLENGTGKDGNSSKYIVSGTKPLSNGENGYGVWKIDANDGTNAAPAVGVTYITFFDFRLVDLEHSNADGTRLVYFGLNSEKNKANVGLNDDRNNWDAIGNSSKNVAPFDMYAYQGGVNVVNDNEISMTLGEWSNIRVEYEILSLDDPATADVNEEKAVVRIYQNGILKNTTIRLANDEMNQHVVAPLESFYVEMRASCSSLEFNIDNLYIGTFAPDNVKGTGKYYNGEAAADVEKIYEFDTDNLTSILAKAGGYTKVNDTTAGNYVAIVDGELVAGTNGKSDTDNVFGWFALNGVDNSTNDGEVGTKYILEMDFKYGGGVGRNSDNRLSYSFGLNGANSGTYASANNAGTTFGGYSLYDGGNNILNFGSATNPAFSLNGGVWYNVRFEYEITSNGYKTSKSEDAKPAWNGTLNVYVNGKLKATKECSSITADVNEMFGSLYFEHNGTDTQYSFDNVYMGIIPNSGTKGSGTYYNKYLNGELILPTIHDFVDDNTINNGDEILAGHGFQLNYQQNSNASSNDRHILVTGDGAMKIGGISTWAEGVINAGSVALKVGQKAVIETDYLFGGSDAQSSYPGELKIRNGNGENIVSPDFGMGSPNDGTCVTFKGQTFEQNTWHNICIVIERTESGANVEYIVDGKSVATETSTEDASVISGIYITIRPGYCPNMFYLLDNMVFANISKTSPDTKGLGAYYNGEETMDYSVSYGFDGVTNISTLISKYGGTTLDSTTGNNYLAAVDGEFVAGTNGDSENAWGWWALKGVDNTYNDGEVGTKYVLEMDFKYNGGTGRSSDKRLSYSFGMNSLSSGLPSSNASATTFAGYTLYDDGNGNLNFGSATAPAFQLNSDVWYNVRFEYTVDHVGYKVSSSAVWQGTLNVYVDGNLVATKKTSSQTAGVNMAFESFYFEHNGSDSEYVMDNIYMGIDNDSAAKGTGVYYKKYLDGEFAYPTVLDFTNDTSITSTHVTSGALNFNNYVPYPGTGEQYTDRHVVLTGAGAMKIGTDSQWADGTINGGNVALNVGDIGVFEMDFMWNGSKQPNATDNYPGDFKLVNASGSTIANLNLAVAAPSDGSAVKLGGSPTFYKGEWHNILVTVERTANGANVTYYADGVQFKQETTTTDCSVLKGIAITVRPASPYMSYLVDNMVFVNTSKAAATSYYDAYEKGYTEYNGNTFVADSTKAWSFDTDETLTKGSGILGNETTSNPNGTSANTTNNSYVNVSGGSLNFGYAGTPTADQSKKQSDILLNLSAAVGQTYVVEYDFTINSYAWNEAAQGKQHSVLNMGLISGTQTTTSVGGNRYRPNSVYDGTVQKIVVNNAEQTSTFEVGKTYKIRVEIKVVNETTASVSYYIDNAVVLENVEKTTSANYLNVSRMRLVNYCCTVADYSIDNLIATVVTTAE